MKFDVVLSNTPFVRDGEWVMPKHIQANIKQVEQNVVCANSLEFNFKFN